MAKLIGVTSAQGSLIEYNGARYELISAPIQLGDIITDKSYEYRDIEKGAYYLVDIERGGYFGFTDDGGDEVAATGTYNCQFKHDIEPEDFRVYRLSTEPARVTAEIIAQKRKELAELEALVNVEEVK